jgi:CRP-like cAMP-binding protein
LVTEAGAPEKAQEGERMVSKEALCPCELFAGLTDEELQQVAFIASEEMYEPGTLILAEQEHATRLYILCEGRVQVHVRLESVAEPSGEMTVEEVDPGRVFGWSALVKQQRFTASVRALEPVRVFAISADELNALFERNAHIGFVVMKGLAEVIASRLRRFRQQCARVAEPD